MCVFSPGPIFECHWNLISQRHSEKKEKSPRKSCLSLQLAQTIQPFIGFVVLCVLISKQACVFVFILDALLKLCAVFNVAVWDFFFSPLAVLVWISMHGVAAGQMHRTVKNQQGELPFPKCQAYNSQNDGVAKKKKDGKKREKREKSFAKEERMVKNVSYIIG